MKSSMGRLPACPTVTIVGGGMITHDQILPTLLHMQRLGEVGEIAVCASRPQTIHGLRSAGIWAQAFPGQSFHGFPESGDAAAGTLS